MEDECEMTDWMVEVSGAVFGNLGVYHSCHLIPDARYCLVGDTQYLSTNTFVGLCLPSSCTNYKSIANLAPKARHLGSNVTTNQTSKLVVFCEGMGAEAWHAGAIAAVVILLVIVLIVVLASFADYLEMLVLDNPLEGLKRKLQYWWRHNEEKASAEAAVANKNGGNFFDGEASDVDVAAHPPEREQRLLSSSPLEEVTPVARRLSFHTNDLSSPVQLQELSDSPPRSFWSRVVRTLQCFSLIRNFQSWRYWRRGAKGNVFNSIRALCLFWIITSDSVILSEAVPTFATPIDTHSVAFAGVHTASLGIATFLFVSGFVSSNSLLDEPVFMKVFGFKHPNAQATASAVLSPTKISTGVSPLQFLGSYLWILAQRWVRLIPLYACIILLIHPVLSRSGSGPFFQTFVDDPALGKNCGDYWWTNFLFINNIYPRKVGDRCFPWTYYFALEFQFFAVAPWILLAYARFSRLAFGGLIFVLATASTIAIGLTDPTAGTVPSITNSSIAGNQTIEFYDLQLACPLLSNDGGGNAFSPTDPQDMIIPFLAGQLLYLLLLEVQQRKREHSFFGDGTGLLATAFTSAEAAQAPVSAFFERTLRVKRNRFLYLWSGVLLLAGMIFLQWATALNLGQLATDSDASHHLTVAVKVLRLPIWCIGATAIILPMLLGYGGWPRRVLSHHLWSGVSRLVLAGYLVGPVLARFANAISMAPRASSVYLVAYLEWGNLSCTFVLAFVLHLFVEQPFVQWTGQTTAASAIDDEDDSEDHDVHFITVAEKGSRVQGNALIIEKGASGRHQHHNVLPTLQQQVKPISPRRLGLKPVAIISSEPSFTSGT